MRDRLPDWWEHRDRVEHSSEIGQRCEDEVGDYRCRVKAICHESVQESDECEEKRREEGEEECEANMSEGYMCKKECHT